LIAAKCELLICDGDTYIHTYSVHECMHALCCLVSCEALSDGAAFSELMPRLMTTRCSQMCKEITRPLKGKTARGTGKLPTSVRTYAYTHTHTHQRTQKSETYAFQAISLSMITIQKLGRNARVRQKTTCEINLEWYSTRRHGCKNGNHTFKV